MNRHGELHKAWDFTSASRRIFTTLPSNWFVLHGELLHNKTTDIKDTHYLYDISIYRGEPLYGVSYEERYELLFDLLHGSKAQTGGLGYLTLDDNTWLATNFYRDFKKLFSGLNHKEDEGLVLKQFAVPWNMRDNNWLRKCRKPTKNYGH